MAAEPDGRREAPEVRQGRRRRDGQLPPARRHRDLRHARAHGAAVLAALPARRRLGQLRLARRRRGRRHALHGVPPGAHRGRDARGTRPGHGRLPARTTTARRPSPSCCRRGCRTCSSTARPASPSAWPPASRRTTSARSARRSSSCSTTPTSPASQLCRYIKGPDFPTGGQILNSAEELKEIYQTGSGSIRVRGTWEAGAHDARRKTVFITSIPYAVNKAQLVERIAEVVIGRKLPPLLDVRDVSTDDVRIELELKKDADEKMVMAYLCKHTPLQTTFPVNLTCLVPTENPERRQAGAARSQVDPLALPALPPRGRDAPAGARARRARPERIHILEGFETVFDALDEILRIIRKSDGKADAAKKIMARFELDAEQTDAILELKLYRLARLEILVIQEELEEKRNAREADRRCCSRARTKRWEHRARRARGAAEDARARKARPAAHPHRVGRGGRVLRRRLHRRGRQRRDRVARRLGEAPEGSEGPGLDAPARGRRACWRCCRGARGRRPCSSRTSAWPTPRGSPTCRRRPATASRSSACSSSATASA